MIVDCVSKRLIIDKECSLSFEEAGALYAQAPHFSELFPPGMDPLSKSELSHMNEIWVEPISIDSELRQELRGWYTVMSDWVENSAGNRFLFDAYQSKWLAFSEVITTGRAGGLHCPLRAICWPSL